MFLRRCAAAGIVLALVLTETVGCQRDESGGKVPAAVGSALSGTTVSAEEEEGRRQKEFWSQVQEGLGLEEKKFSHNNMTYFAELEEDETGEETERWSLVQQGPDGGELRRYDIPGLTAVWGIGGNWLYYKTQSQDEEDMLWRVPVEGSERNGALRLDEKEKLTTMPGLVDLYESIYISETCVVFEGMHDNDGSGIYKCELDTKKCTLLSEGYKYAGGVLGFTSDHKLAVLDGRLLIQTDRFVYALEPESGQMTRLMGKDKNVYAVMGRAEDSMFISPDCRQVLRYDGGEEKPVCVVSSDTFRKRLEELRLWGTDGEYRDHTIDDIYTYGDRLYFSVTVDWGKKGGNTEYKKIGNILFSAGTEDAGNMVCLEGLLKYMEGYKEEAETDFEMVMEYPDEAEVYAPSRIAGIKDGKVILSGVAVAPAYISSISFLPCEAYDIETGAILANPAVKIRNGKKEGD